jgi:hypothetical protein
MSTDATGSPLAGPERTTIANQTSHWRRSLRISWTGQMLKTLTSLSNQHSRHLAMIMMAGLMMLSVAACGSGSSSSVTTSPQFIVCKSTYALCSTALCSPIPGDDQNVSCNCNVMTGYSAGTTKCAGVQKSGDNLTVISRYYPIKSYLRCSNDRPWAMCLNGPVSSIRRILHKPHVSAWCWRTKALI